MYDARLLPVSDAEYVQHMLRHASGFFVEGLRGHREVWALVNTLLILESRGKGYAVQRNVMHRIGGRLSGHRVTTRAQLQEMIQGEEHVRTLVHQLMTVGKDVRSTPMSWVYEGKKLNKECKRKGTNGLRAFEACPITCRECPPGPRFPTKSPSVDPSSSPSDSPTNAYCLDSDTWSSKQGRTCVDIADRVAETGKDPKKVCKKHKDLDGVTAVQACPATCDYQNCSLRRRQ